MSYKIDGPSVSVGHSDFRFGSVQFIQVGMFRNRLGTRHFSDRFGSENVGFGSGSYFFIKPEVEPYYK